jgi:hypothetical protein
MQPNQMKSLTPDKSEAFCLEAEYLVKRSYEKILLDNNLSGLFADPKKREEYLDDLVYSE